MRILKLTLPEGQEIFVNADHVVWVREPDRVDAEYLGVENGAQLLLSVDLIVVRESVGYVLAQLEGK